MKHYGVRGSCFSTVVAAISDVTLTRAGGVCRAFELSLLGDVSTSCCDAQFQDRFSGVRPTI